VISPLEASIIGACARSGRLDQGCFYLSDYYGKLETVRRFIIKSSLYPAFVLHFGVFATALPKLVMPGGTLAAYLRGTLGFLLLLYGFGIIAALLISILVTQGARSTLMDRFLRLLPLVGKTRRAFALSRFCATYEMQLLSGVNVMDAITSASNASQSALVGAAVRKALPLIRGGAQVGPLLSGSSAFTEAMVRGIKIGEQTGDLDNELKRLADEFQQEAVSRMAMLAAFFKWLLILLVAVYTGWQILGFYTDYFHQVESFGNGLQ
jgi:type II secretory pathway component PulF